MNYVPLVIFVLVIAGLIAFSARARRRQAAAQADMAARIDVGTDVMTTSGLHGTVVTLNGDETVQLSIAPGIEVRWELAALRDTAALPVRYRHDEPAEDDLPSDEVRERVDLDKLGRLDKGDPSRGSDPL